MPGGTKKGKKKRLIKDLLRSFEERDLSLFHATYRSGLETLPSRMWHINMDILDGSCWTILHYAASHGLNGFIRAICQEYSPDINCPSAHWNKEEGYTPLMLAAASGHVSTVQMLVADIGVDIYLRNSVGETASGVAARVCFDKSVGRQILDILEEIQWRDDLEEDAKDDVMPPVDELGMTKNSSFVIEKPKVGHRSRTTSSADRRNDSIDFGRPRKRTSTGGGSITDPFAPVEPFGVFAGLAERGHNKSVSRSKSHVEDPFDAPDLANW